MRATYKSYRCSGCGANGLVPLDFTPAHFTGSLSHLSAGYCTIECARRELNHLISEHAKGVSA